MKYHCNQCDKVFELGENEKLRCPACMGIHNIEIVKEGSDGAKTSASSGRSMKVPAILVLVALVAACGYFMWRAGRDPQADGAISQKELGQRMEGLGIDAGSAVVPFEVTPKVLSFATANAGGETGDDALAALHHALAALKKSGRWTPYRQSEPRMTHPFNADALAETLSDNKAAPVALSSYELACLLFAAAKSLEAEGLHMVEIYSYTGEKMPADPNAIYGRYAVALGTPSPENSVQVFDPWGGRQVESSAIAFELLTPESAIAPWYSQLSLSAFASMDMTAALKENDITVKLSPNNALYKILRGKIFLASGAVEEGMAEFEKARKLKDWAVTRASLAQISMLTDPSGSAAETDIRKSLQEFPDYLQAHVILAALMMQRGEMDKAKSALSAAEAIDPASVETATAWAQFHIISQDTESAIAAAKKAVRLSNESYTSLLMLAQVYQATGNFDEAREAAQKAIAQIPSEELKEQLRTAFNISDEASATADTSTDKPDTDSLPDGPSKLELKLENEGGTTLGGGKLRLGGDSGQGLGGGGLKL